MKRICAIIFFFAAATLTPPSAMAGVPTDAATKASAAAADFATLAHEAQAQGAVPHWRDAKTQAVMARMLDTALFGTPPYSAKDGQAVQAVVMQARGAYQIYVAYLQDAIKGKSAAEAQARAKDVQDETARFNAFFLRSLIVTMPAMADFVAHLKPEDLTETRLQGLRRMRLGAAQIVLGACLLVREGPSQENQAILVDAVADTAAPIAAALSLPARVQVADQLREQFVGLPAPLAARVGEAEKAMASTKCSGLCTLE